MRNLKHIPVMKNEAVEALNVRDNLNYVDATFGQGGYSEEILKKANCTLLAIDKDPSVLDYAKKLKKYKKRFSFVNEDFAKLESIVKKNKNKTITGGIIADLGVSSIQLDDEKEVSLNKNGPLDMRMSMKGKTAQDLIYKLSEKDLARVLWEYGDEKKVKQ